MGRKRNLSATDAESGECGFKKLKANSERLTLRAVKSVTVTDKVIAKTVNGHVVHGNSPGLLTRNNQDSCDVGNTDKILQAIENMQKCFSDKLIALENKLTSSLLEIVKTEINDVKAEFTERISEVVSRVDALEGAKHVCVERASLDISLNIVIRNLPEGRDENVINKVNGLIKDGLKLRDITVTEAARKNSGRMGRPGLIVAKCRSAEEKETIMNAKKKLPDSRNLCR